MEREIIKGKSYDVKRACNRIAIGIVVLGVALYTVWIATAMKYLHGEFRTFANAWITCLFGRSKYGSAFGGYIFATSTIIPAIAIAVGVLLVKWWLGSMEITVTDKRVYGKAAFGKRVDLPLDSISAVAISALKGIAVASSSGSIVFKFIKNNEDVHSAISKLLIERQIKNNEQNTANNKEVNSKSDADELKKYKELFDCGAITQEEYDAKKKHILGV